jgi:predicted nucleic acid-binding protein
MIMVAEITLAEAAAALAAKHRAPHGLSRQELTDAVADFLGHGNREYPLVPVDRFIIERAVGVTQHHRLRGYDAVQLGAALVTNQVLTNADLAALTFVTADDDLLHAAQAEGLSSENPNMHS